MIVVALAGLAAGMMATVAPARAQIVAVVSGDVITERDVTLRTHLLTLINNGRTPARKAVIEELIDEKLKIREAFKFKMVPEERDVETAYANVATRARMSVAQFDQFLISRGTSPVNFKGRLIADMSWSELVRARFKLLTQVGERDVAAAMPMTGQNDANNATEFTLRQIVFVLPRNASDATIEARRREAEGLRNRFQSCDTGLSLVRGLREVVVRDPVKRMSPDLTPALRELFNNTQDGRVTPPERTEAGIEVVAVCSRREISGQSVKEADMRQELIGKRMQAQAQRYIAELRRAALIEYR